MSLYITSNDSAGRSTDMWRERVLNVALPSMNDGEFWQSVMVSTTRIVRSYDDMQVGRVRIEPLPVVGDFRSFQVFVQYRERESK